MISTEGKWVINCPNVPVPEGWCISHPEGFMVFADTSLKYFRKLNKLDHAKLLRSNINKRPPPHAKKAVQFHAIIDDRGKEKNLEIAFYIQNNFEVLYLSQQTAWPAKLILAGYRPS